MVCFLFFFFDRFENLFKFTSFSQAYFDVVPAENRLGKEGGEEGDGTERIKREGMRKRTQ